MEIREEKNLLKSQLRIKLYLRGCRRNKPHIVLRNGKKNLQVNAKLEIWYVKILMDLETDLI